MPRRVAIVGVALSDTGRVDHKTSYELHAQAVRRAVADSGLRKDDIDGLASNGLGTLQPIEIAEYLHLPPPRWVDSTQVGGGTWEVMACHAADAIAMGHADVIVLVYGSTTRADLKKGIRRANLSYGNRGPMQFEAPYGHSLIAKYAMSTRRHMHEYGTTIEQLAEISVSARYNAQFNPVAYYRDPLTIDEVLSGKMMADPFTKLQCCIRSDGGCAVVLAAEDRVPDTAKAPVWILGHGHSVSHMTMSEWSDFTVGPAAAAGRDAFGRAGVTATDIDVACIYDAFTFMELCTLEDLGFCAKGDGGEYVADGKLRLGGAMPTNPDGGGLSACHPGMRGLFLMVEATRQLRGDYADGNGKTEDGEPIPAERQVPDAKLAVASGTGGWFCSNGTLVLGVD
jgi:acetyl-CoA acetyltransferase